VLAERRGTLAGDLSGGEQQMLEMAMALVRRPRVLVLDEPSIGLGPAVVGELFAEIRRVRGAGVAVVVVEQNVRKALNVATRAVVMRTGRIVYDGPPDLDAAALARLFLPGRAPEPSPG